MSLPPGSRLGAYEIVNALGEGGMGEVYRARDARLGRDVALKILPPDVVNEAGRLARFDREARAIAALNHPHIVTIYSTEEADGVRFLTMELVDGHTLAESVVAGGVSIPKFLDIAVPLADALTAAHQKEITHRDLKPANVMVTHDGRVKVLDFGLARVGGAEHRDHSLAATLAPVTQHGTIVGTMPYMSPEQVEGATLDPRSDLFSLGVIFYELLTGARPFQGGSSPALMSAILRDTPAEISSVRADVPDSLVRLIARCLEKRPEDRVQTARDVFNELRHLQKQLDSSATRRMGGSGSVSSISSTTLDTLSIAVLPFGVRGDNADADAIATGLTEDIGASLSKFYGLSLVAPQSARAYKDSALDVRQIAERLNARYILGGSVRKAGTTVRVASQLVDAHTGAMLWSDTYNRQLADADVFTVQDDVTDHIVATIADASGVLARSMAQAVRQHTPINQATARELVVRSWGFQHNPTPAEHAELRVALEARLVLEPHNAHLWAHFAATCLAEHSLFFNPSPDTLERVLRAARRAIEIEPTNQKGWETLAIAHFHLHDAHAMQDAADRAVRINPRNANTLARIGNVLTHCGEYDRGCALTERAMAINSAHPGWLHFAVFNRHFARQEYAEALAAARRINVPDFMWMHFGIAAACGQLGLAKEGQAAYERMTRIAPILAEETNCREFVRRWYWRVDMIEALLDGVSASRGAKQGSQAGDHATRDASLPATPTPISSHRGSGSTAPSDHAQPAPSPGLRVAVLPFSARAGDDESAAIAEALTEDITTGLSRFGNLRVLSRGSANRLAAARGPGDPPSARYVIDGSVRRAGATVRVSVRLADAQTGANVWAELFNVDAGPGTLAVQDDIANRIVATVGDQTGVLASAMMTAIADTPLDELSVPELVVRYHAFTMHLREDEHARLRAAFERAVEREPRAANAWASLAMLYEMEHSHNFNQQPDPLARQRHAAQRAVEADPQSQQAWTALASTHLFARDLPALRGAVERAVSLNPLNADLVALCAVFISVAGDGDRAMELARSAAQVKPNHPGWYHFPAVNAHYLRGEYEDALREAKQINMPHMVLAHLSAAAAAGQAGRAAEAQTALDALRHTAPALLDPHQARRVWGIWIWNEEFLDRLAEGLARALTLVGGPGATRPASSLKTADSDSGTHSAFTVNVLPFQAPASGDAASLAEGLSQGVVVGLSRFQYLRVIARAVAPDTIAAGYKLQGSVREAGGVVRVVMQLSDAHTGANVWADTYDRDLRGASLFDLQDELTATIVATIADANGALVRSMSATVRGKPVDSLTPYEAVLRRFAYISVMSPPEHALVRDALELAVARAPGYAAAWAMLAQIYVDEFAQGYNPRPNALERARAAADKALDLDPSSQPAFLALAMIGFFSKDAGAFRAAADRALALNPLDSATMSLLGTFTAYSGDWETGLALAERARTLNPHHPGIYWLVLIVDHYRHGNYAAALEILNRVNMPSYPNSLLVRAAIYGQLGRIDEGRELMREAEAKAPGITSPDSGARARWLSPELITKVQEGLDKLNTE